MGSHELRSLIDALDILIESRRAKADELRDFSKAALDLGKRDLAAKHAGSALAIDDYSDKLRDMLAQYKRQL